MDGAAVSLTSTGFAIKTFDEFKTEIEDEIRANAALNPNGRIDLSAQSVIGQLVGIFAAKLAEMHEVMQAVYASAYASSAEGAALDAVVDLIGLTRRAATGSRVTLRLTGINGTVIPSGSTVRDPDRPDVEWDTLASATIAAGVATVEAQCSTNGVITANANTLTEIVTPIAGWNTVLNQADATPGLAEETDVELRQRLVDLAFATGSSTTSAIRAALLQVEGVTDVGVFENNQEATNAFGVPAKTIEAVVDGGADADIAQAIFDNKAAGIGTYSASSDSGSATDANGDAVTINFSRPDPIDCYVFAAVTHDGNNPDIEAEIEAAIVAFGDTSRVGQNVIRSRFYSVIHAVSGVLNVSILGISRVSQPTAGTSTTNDITIAFRERAVFDTSRVVLTLTRG